jgi:hypothetical protein
MVRSASQRPPNAGGIVGIIVGCGIIITAVALLGYLAYARGSRKDLDSPTGTDAEAHESYKPYTGN